MNVLLNINNALVDKKLYAIVTLVIAILDSKTDKEM